jgi:SNF2 family DNA or RNA helicase
LKTYGTVKFDGALWLIDAEPHVILKLKRVFPKVSKKSHGTIKLTDTVEVARDLEWFMARYPLDADEATREKLIARAAAHRENETLVASLLAGIRPPRAFNLALPPREYQKIAADLCIATGGLLVVDDVGLGKTCTGICVLTHEDARPALVVTLTHLPPQWKAEIEKFAPGLRVHVLKKATPYPLTSNPKQLALNTIEPSTPDVIICNYHKLDGWASTLAGLVKTVIFDEVQELRREGSNKTSAAKAIAARAKYRLGLSATPIYNLGDEMFSVMEAVRPGAMGARSEFVQEWCTKPDSYDRSRISNPKAFGTYLRDAGLMIRRTRSDVGRELPPLTKVPQQVDCDTKALDKVESSATELARIIMSQATLGRGEKFRAAEEFSMLMRQATGIAKAPYVAEFVKMLLDSEEKIVLYGWHRTCYDLWLDRLSAFHPVMFTGSESANEKEQSRKAFTKGKSRVLFMSLRAGAGLDGLQEVCRTVVFGELDWSPGVHEQCTGRIYRDGQRDPVFAYYLMADSGSDPIVADVLGMKTSQIRGIRDPQGGLVEALQGDGQHVKRLAQDFLKRRGISSRVLQPSERPSTSRNPR